MDTGSRVLVTGATGMVGAALVSKLKALGHTGVLAPPRSELDLLRASDVDLYFDKNRPEYVFMVAARVGGIAANMAEPAAFLAENTSMQLNVFAACVRHRTRKNLFLGSSCIYPRLCPQPMKEEHLLTGPLEPTNEGYALAKLMGLKLAQYHHQQHGMLTVCPLPCNIYGTGDHFDLARSHVLSALVRRFVDARDAGRPSVTLWGTGAARREFIHVQDVVRAMLFLMDRVEDSAPVNVGTGEDVSIAELAGLIAQRVGYTGQIEWDPSKPDGMPRKCLDVSRLSALGFRAAVSIEEGIGRTVSEYGRLKAAGAV